MRAGLVALALVLASGLTACHDDEIRSGIGVETAEPPGEYAAYLAMRATSRERAALLVRGLADALGGTVGTIDGDWEGCGQRGEETYAFSYGVTAVVDGTRVEEGLPTVELVLRAQGWTVSTSRPYRGSRFVEATRDDVSVVVNEGIPADRLVVRTSGGCFGVPEEHRDELRQDLDDARIPVPPPAPPLRRAPR
jgi:hypothetical protein